MTKTDKERAADLMQIAFRHQMSGRLQEAIENYKLSIDLHPTAEAHTYYGWALSFIAEFDEAIAQCKTAIGLDPDFGNPYNDIGAYLIQKGEPDEAMPWLQLAINAKRYATPHFPHYNMGRILERRGEWFEALDEYRQALAIEAGYTLAKDAYYRLLGLLN